MGTDGFEQVNDRDILASESPWFDWAAVEQHPRNVQPQECHRTGGNRLVTSHKDDEGVKHVPARNEFNGICDDLPRNEGRLHALSPHGDPIADGDGIQFHWRTTGVADALLDLLGKGAKAPVARHCFNPRVSHADDWPTQVFVGETDCMQHCPGGNAVTAIKLYAALMTWICNQVKRCFGVAGRWRGSHGRGLLAMSGPASIPAFAILRCGSALRELRAQGVSPARFWPVPVPKTKPSDRFGG